MKALGVLLALLGWVIAVTSLSLENTTVQLAIVLLGIAISFFGIMGVLNRAYIAEAIWKQ